VPAERLQERKLRSRENDRDGVEDAAGRQVYTGRACEHRIPDRRRNGWLAPREHLGDEERVAAGASEQFLGVHVVRRRKLPYRIERQRRNGNPLDPGCGRKTAQDHPQRVGGVQLVVAEGADDERGARLYAPAQ
jgi:hypothetical protein